MPQPKLRARVLAAYGGKCVICARTHLALEIDHITSDGAAHRKTFNTTIAQWLHHQYRTTGFWPTSVQLLCTLCHARKSGRLPHMPARAGAHQVNVTLDDVVYAQLAAIAEQPAYQGSKSSVVTEALRVYLEGTLSQTILETLHQRLAEGLSGVRTVLNEVRQREEALHASVTALQGTVQHSLRALETRLEALEQQGDHQHRELVHAYDRLKDIGESQRSWFKR